jgi:hypothetical protein
MDLFIELQSDFLLTANGDIVAAEGWDEVRQRIERRIFTNPAAAQDNGAVIPADYIFDPEYGLGARAAVGNTFTQQMIAAFTQRIYEGVMVDQGVNNNVPPVITVKQVNPQNVEFSIQVTLATGLAQTILLSLP